MEMIRADCVGKCGARVWPTGAMCPDCVVGARIVNKLAGLRRAQELAKEHVKTTDYEDADSLDWTDVDQAILAEVKKVK